MEEIQVYGPFITKKQAIEKGIAYYYTGLPCKKGHISVRRSSSGHCMECRKESVKRERDKPEYQAKRKKYLDSRRSIIREQGKINAARWRTRNPEKYRSTRNAAVKRWTERNPEKARQINRLSVKKFIKNNPERAQKMWLRNRTNWINNNPELYALVNRHKSRINKMINNGLAPKGENYNNSKTLGCSSKEFKEHIESQFTEGMSWENRDMIHIDHIRPITTFNLFEDEQRMVRFNYRNLQPLWAEDNLAKLDNYTPLDELAWVERMQALGYEGELFLKYEEGNSY